MTAVIASALVLAGALFALVAAVGIVRMPDLYCRMHAATKAGAFGLGLILLGLAVAAPQPRVIIQGALIVAFFYLTAPLAAQMLGRVAMKRGIRCWQPGSGKSSPPAQ